MQSFQAVEMPRKVFLSFRRRKAKCHIEVAVMSVDAGDIKQRHIESIDLLDIRRQRNTVREGKRGRETL